MLCGCKAEDDAMQRALDVRAALLQAGGCRFTGNVRVSYDESVFDFTMDCTYQTDGASQMEITAPQSLKGIRASLGKDDAQLRFEDTVVSFDGLAEGNFAPMAFPLLLGQCLCEDYISAAGRDNGALRVTYLHDYDEKELRVEVWFAEDALQPQYAEVYHKGKLLLSAQLSDFTKKKEDCNGTAEKNVGGDLAR